MIFVISIRIVINFLTKIANKKLKFQREQDNIIQSKNMKSSITESKRSQKKSGYAASYADKYKMKGAKVGVEEQKLWGYQQRSRLGIGSYKPQGVQSSSTKSSLIFSSPNYPRTPQRSTQPILQAQWIGGDYHPISPQQSSLIPGQSQEQKTLSSIEPQSPHQLTLRKHSNILIQQQLQDDLNTYNNYRMIEKQYTQQMQKIKQQRERIQKQCKNQRKRIAQAQQLLLDRKRILNQVEAKYQALRNKGEKERKQERETIERYEKMIVQLNQQYDTIKKQKQQQLQKLSKQLTYSQGENGKLQAQLTKLQEELRMYQQNTNQEQEKTMQQLQKQEVQLKKDIEQIQLQQAALLTQLQNLNAHTLSQPIITAQHTQYLTIYRNSFLLTQLQRAQQLLRLKQLQQQQHLEIQKRKSMIKQKQIQLTLKEKRINEKHKLIDQLTQDIREKSTLLLNLYQQQYH